MKVDDTGSARSSSLFGLVAGDFETRAGVASDRRRVTDAAELLLLVVGTGADDAEVPGGGHSRAPTLDGLPYHV